MKPVPKDSAWSEHVGARIALIKATSEKLRCFEVLETKL
jgi:hypothetical protein